MSRVTSGRRLKPVNTPLRPVNVDAVAFTVNFMAPSALEIIEMSLVQNKDCTDYITFKSMYAYYMCGSCVGNIHQLIVRCS